MKNNLNTIIKKELSRFFMDKKLLLTTAILPGLMIYIIYTLMGGMFSSILQTDENYVYKIKAVHSSENTENFFSQAGLSFTEIGANELDDAKQDITDGRLDLCIVFPESFDTAVSAYDIADGTPAPEIQLFYNSGETASLESFQAANALFDAYENSMINKFDVNTSEAVYDLANGTDLMSRIMTSIVPMLFLTLLFSGCCSIAPDFIAGEKERGTIATLLVTPMKRSSLALGKIISMSVMTLLSGISSFLGVALSFPKLANMGDDTNIFDFSALGIPEYAVLLLLVLSVVLVLISLLSVVSAQATTVKESSTAIGPLNIVVMIIGIAGGYMGATDANVLTSLVPIYNFAKCMSAMLCGTVDMANIIVAILSNLVYTALCTWLLTKMFNSEKIMFPN